MREIINLLCGQSGNEIGSKFIGTISSEHGINQNGLYTGKFPQQLEQVNAYFHEYDQRKYKSRTILIDTDSKILDQIICKPEFGQFRSENFIFTNGTTEHIWAKGFYNQGNQLIDQCMDTIRRETERCDSLQGFSLTHSLGGGTGSGIGSLITQTIKEEYSDTFIQTFSIAPTLSKNEPINVILGLGSLNSDESIIFDHDAMHEICFRKQKIVTPSFGDINYLATTAMASFTSYFRFKTDFNLHSLANHLIPFPKTNLLSMSYSLMFARGSTSQYHIHPVKRLTQFLYDPKYSLITTYQNKYLASSTLCRGQFSESEVKKEINAIQSYIEWIPGNSSLTFLQFPLQSQRQQLSCIANNTSISDLIHKVQVSLNQLLRKKAYLHRYTREGMELEEIVQASEKMNDVIAEYQSYQNTCFLGLE